MTTPTLMTPATVVTGRLGRPSSPGAHPAPLLPELDVSTTCAYDTADQKEETSRGKHDPATGRVVRHASRARAVIMHLVNLIPYRRSGEKT